MCGNTFFYLSQVFVASLIRASTCLSIIPSPHTCLPALEALYYIVAASDIQPGSVWVSSFGHLAGLASSFPQTSFRASSSSSAPSIACPWQGRQVFLGQDHSLFHGFVSPTSCINFVPALSPTLTIGEFINLAP